MSSLRGAVDGIDIRMERIARLIDTAATFDRELAAGHGTQIPMSVVQSDIEVALVNVDRLQRAIRDAAKKPSTRK
jgi:hypothetical protein